MALEIQRDVYGGDTNNDVKETMVLLAEALTLTHDEFMIGEAVRIYEELQSI